MDEELNIQGLEQTTDLLGNEYELTKDADLVKSSNPDVLNESADQLLGDEDTGGGGGTMSAEELIAAARQALGGASGSTRKERRRIQKESKKIRKQQEKAKQDNPEALVAANPPLGFLNLLATHDHGVIQQVVTALDGEGLLSELLKSAGYENLWVTGETTASMLRVLACRTDTSQVLKDIEALTSTGLFQLDFSVNRYEARLAWELLLTLPRDLRDPILNGVPPEVKPPTGFAPDAILPKPEPTYEGLKPPKALKKADRAAYEQDLAYYEAEKAKYEEAKKLYDEQQTLFMRDLEKNPERAEEWEQYQTAKKLASRRAGSLGGLIGGRKIEKNLSVEYRNSSRFDTYDGNTTATPGAGGATGPGYGGSGVGRQTGAPEATAQTSTSDRQQLLTELMDDATWAGDPSKLRGLLKLAVQADETAFLKPYVAKHWGAHEAMLTGMGFAQDGSYGNLRIKDETYTTGLQRFIAGAKAVGMVLGGLGILSGPKAEKEIDLQSLQPLLDKHAGLRLTEMPRDSQFLSLATVLGGAKAVNAVLKLTGWDVGQLIEIIDQGVKAGETVEKAMKIGENTKEHLEFVQEVLAEAGEGGDGAPVDDKDANKVMLGRDNTTGETSMAVPKLPISSQSATFGTTTVKMGTSLVEGFKATLKTDTAKDNARFISVRLDAISLNELLIVTPEGMVNIGAIGLDGLVFEAHAPDGRPRSVLEKMMANIGNIVHDLALRIIKFLPIAGWIKGVVSVADAGVNAARVAVGANGIMSDGFEAFNFAFDGFNLNNLTTSGGDHIGQISVGATSIDVTAEDAMGGSYLNKEKLEDELSDLQRKQGRLARKLSGKQPGSRGYDDLKAQEKWTQDEIGRVLRLLDLRERVYPLERKLTLLGRDLKQLEEDAGGQPNAEQKKQIERIQAEMSQLSLQIQGIKAEGVDVKGKIGAVEVKDVDVAGTEVKSVTMAETQLGAGAKADGEGQSAGISASNANITLTGLKYTDTRRADAQLDASVEALIASGTTALSDNLGKRNGVVGALADQAAALASSAQKPEALAKAEALREALTVQDPKGGVDELIGTLKAGGGEAFELAWGQTYGIDGGALAALVSAFGDKGAEIQAAVEGLYTFQRQLDAQVRDLARQHGELAVKRAELEPLLQEYALLRRRLTDPVNPLSGPERSRYTELHKRLHNQEPELSVEKASIEGVEFQANVGELTDLAGTNAEGGATTDLSQLSADLKASKITLEGVEASGTRIERVTSEGAGVSFNGAGGGGVTLDTGKVSIDGGDTGGPGITMEGRKDQVAREQGDVSGELAEVRAELGRLRELPAPSADDTTRMGLLEQRLATLEAKEASLNKEVGSQDTLKAFVQGSATTLDKLRAWNVSDTNPEGIDFTRGVTAKTAREAAGELLPLVQAKQAELAKTEGDIQTFQNGIATLRGEYDGFKARRDQAEAEIKANPYNTDLAGQRQDDIAAIDIPLKEREAYILTAEGLLKGHQDARTGQLMALQTLRAQHAKAAALASTYEAFVAEAHEAGVDPTVAGLTTPLEEMSADGIVRLAQAIIDGWDGMSVGKIAFEGDVSVTNLGQLKDLKTMFGAQPTGEGAPTSMDVGFNVAQLSVEDVKQGDRTLLKKLDLGALKGRAVMKDENTVHLPELEVGTVGIDGVDWGDASMGFKTSKLGVEGVKLDVDIQFDPLTGAMTVGRVEKLDVNTVSADALEFRYGDYLIDMNQVRIAGGDQAPGVALRGMDLNTFAFDGMDLNGATIDGLGADLGAGLEVSAKTIKADNIHLGAIFTPQARVQIDQANLDAMQNGEALEGDMANKYTFDLTGVDAAGLGVKMKTMGLDMQIDAAKGDLKGMDFDMNTEVFNFADLKLSQFNMGSITFDSPDMLFANPGGMNLKGVQVCGRYEMKTGKAVLDKVVAEDAQIGQLQYKTYGPGAMDISLQNANATNFRMSDFVYSEDGISMQMDLGKSDIDGLKAGMEGMHFSGGFTLNSLSFDMLKDGDMLVDFAGVSSKQGQDFRFDQTGTSTNVEGEQTESTTGVTGRIDNASGHVGLQGKETVFKDITVGSVQLPELTWKSEGGGNLSSLKALQAKVNDVKVSGRMVAREPKMVAGMPIPVSDLYLDDLSVATLDADSLTYTDSAGISVTETKAGRKIPLMQNLKVSGLQMIDGQLEDGRVDVERVGASLDIKQDSETKSKFLEVLNASSSVEARGLWAEFDKGKIDGGVQSLDVDGTSLNWDMESGHLLVDPLSAEAKGISGGTASTDMGDAAEFAQSDAVWAHVDELALTEDAPIAYTAKPDTRNAPPEELKTAAPELYARLQQVQANGQELDKDERVALYNSLPGEERAVVSEYVQQQRRNDAGTSKLLRELDRNVLNTLSGSIKIEITMKAAVLIETLESAIKALTGGPVGIGRGILNQLKLAFNVVREKFTGKKEYRTWHVIEIVNGQVQGDLGAIIGLVVGMSQAFSAGLDAVGELGDAIGANAKALWESTPVDLIMMLWSQQQRDEFNDAWANARKENQEVMEAFGKIADIFSKLRRGDLSTLKALDAEFGVIDMLAGNPDDEDAADRQKAEQETYDAFMKEVTRIPDPNGSAMSWLDQGVLGFFVDRAEVDLSTKPYTLELGEGTTVQIPSARIHAETVAIDKGRLSVKGNMNLSGLGYSSKTDDSETTASVGQADVDLKRVTLETRQTAQGRSDTYRATLGRGTKIKNVNFYQNKFTKHA